MSARKRENLFVSAVVNDMGMARQMLALADYSARGWYGSDGEETHVDEGFGFRTLVWLSKQTLILFGTFTRRYRTAAIGKHTHTHMHDTKDQSDDGDDVAVIFTSFHFGILSLCSASLR